MPKRLRCYRAFWPNGDVSFSFAQSRRDCELMLDEEADPGAAEVEEIDCPEGMTFHLSCKPPKGTPPGSRGLDHSWYLDAHSESVFEHMVPEALCRNRVWHSLVFWRGVRIIRHRFGDQRHSDECEATIGRFRLLSKRRQQQKEEELKALAALGTDWMDLDPNREEYEA